MTPSAELRRAIDAAAPFWAGEAEVATTYFASPGRSRQSDRRWLAYQCYRQLRADDPEAPALAPLQRLAAIFASIDVEVPRWKAHALARGFWSRFARYCAFADAYDGMAKPGEPRLEPAALESWEANEALGRLRRQHRAAHDVLGEQVCSFTEHGSCALASAGKMLERQGEAHEGRNGLIAAACATVQAQETGDMVKRIAALDGIVPHAEWPRFERLALEQLALRLLMRNEQFGRPLGDRRLAEIRAGAIEPLPFDWGAAGRAAPLEAPGSGCVAA